MSKTMSPLVASLSRRWRGHVEKFVTEKTGRFKHHNGRRAAFRSERGLVMLWSAEPEVAWNDIRWWVFDNFHGNPGEDLRQARLYADEFIDLQETKEILAEAHIIGITEFDFENE